MRMIDEIPERYKTGFQYIIELNQKLFEKLLTVIKEEKPTLGEDKLANKISYKLTEVDKHKIEEIISTILSLYILEEDSELKRERIIDDISILIKEGEITELKPESINVEDIKSRLRKLLELDTIKVSSKAARIMLENKYTYCTAKIMTDLRPVFFGDINQGPREFVIFHNLRINYHYGDRGKKKEIYIAMDEDDVEDLKKVLERAESKATELKKLLNQSKINYLSIKE